MLILSRLLSRRALRAVLGLRAARSQAKQSGDLNLVALLVMAVVGLWTYRREKRRQRRVVRRSQA